MAKEQRTAAIIDAVVRNEIATPLPEDVKKMPQDPGEESSPFSELKVKQERTAVNVAAVGPLLKNVSPPAQEELGGPPAAKAARMEVGQTFGNLPTKAEPGIVKTTTTIIPESGGPEKTPEKTSPQGGKTTATVFPNSHITGLPSTSAPSSAGPTDLPRSGKESGTGTGPPPGTTVSTVPPTVPPTVYIHSEMHQHQHTHMHQYHHPMFLQPSPAPGQPTGAPTPAPPRPTPPTNTPDGRLPSPAVNKVPQTSPRQGHPVGTPLGAPLGTPLGAGTPVGTAIPAPGTAAYHQLMSALTGSKHVYGTGQEASSVLNGQQATVMNGHSIPAGNGQLQATLTASLLPQAVAAPSVKKGFERRKGRWCALHGSIAYMIYKKQQEQKDSALHSLKRVSTSAAPSAGGSANKLQACGHGMANAPSSASHQSPSSRAPHSTASQTMTSMAGQQRKDGLMLRQNTSSASTLTTTSSQRYPHQTSETRYKNASTSYTAVPGNVPGNVPSNIPGNTPQSLGFNSASLAMGAGTPLSILTQQQQANASSLHHAGINPLARYAAGNGAALSSLNLLAAAGGLPDPRLFGLATGGSNALLNQMLPASLPTSQFDWQSYNSLVQLLNQMPSSSQLLASLAATSQASPSTAAAAAALQHRLGLTGPGGFGMQSGVSGSRPSHFGSAGTSQQHFDALAYAQQQQHYFNLLNNPALSSLSAMNSQHTKIQTGDFASNLEQLSKQVASKAGYPPR